MKRLINPPVLAIARIRATHRVAPTDSWCGGGRDKGRPESASYGYDGRFSETPLQIRGVAGETRVAPKARPMATTGVSAKRPYRFVVWRARQGSPRKRVLWLRRAFQRNAPTDSWCGGRDKGRPESASYGYDGRFSETPLQIRGVAGETRVAPTDSYCGGGRFSETPLQIRSVAGDPMGSPHGFVCGGGGRDNSSPRLDKEKHSGICFSC